MKEKRIRAEDKRRRESHALFIGVHGRRTEGYEKRRGAKKEGE